MNNIIFLDLDGVLNSTRSIMATKCARMGSVRQPTYLRLDDMVKDEIDPISVNLVNGLVRLTNSKIVISSSHRNFFYKPDEPINMMEVTRYFQFFGIRGDILDVTPMGESDEELLRGEKIAQWLESNHCQLLVNHYVILDDLPPTEFLSDQQANYVWVDPEVGFTIANFYQAISILMDKPISTVKEELTSPNAWDWLAWPAHRP